MRTTTHRLSTETRSWQKELAAAFTAPEALLAFLELESALVSGAIEASRRFAFKVPRPYAARMEKGNPDDPLLRQVLPLSDEVIRVPGYDADPVGDREALVSSGVLHKYHGRALLIMSGACAVNCRYCFRRAFPYSEGQLHKQQEARAMAYFRADSRLHEVILSGGDPLILSDARLEGLIRNIADIPHIKRLRIHSRLPVVLPSRITQRLIDSLTATRLKTVLVVHANHANEIDRAVEEGATALNAAGIALFNQSVLLKGVNDCADALIELCETLFENRIIPYYLHLLDKTAGTAHFDIPGEHAVTIHEALRRRLPGYMVPRLVREQAGAPYKIVI